MIKPSTALTSLSDSSLRLQLLYTLSDILLYCVDAYATNKVAVKGLRDILVERNIDDLIWNLVFHKRIEELRTDINKASQTDPSSTPSSTKLLLTFLGTATTFYRSLIQSVSVYCTGDSSLSSNTTDLYFGRVGRRKGIGKDDEEFFKLIQRIIFKSVVYLGDLERYKSTYCQESKSLEKWKDVTCIYEYAMRIDPEQGKPQSQLAIVATTCKNYMEALYMYSLSIANASPLQLAKGNLFTFHQKVTSRIPLVTATLDTKTVTLDTLSNAIIQFHRLHLFHPDDTRILNNWRPETYTNIASLQSIIYTVVDKFIGGERSTAMKEEDGMEDQQETPAIPVSKTVSDLLLKTIVVYITAFTELGVMFGERDKAPQVKQRIRDLQCIILSTLFKISATCLEQLQVYTTTSNNDEITSSTATTDETASLFAPMGILCSWIYSTFLPITTDSGVSVEQLLSVPQNSNKNNQRTSGDRLAGGASGPTVLPMDVFSLFLKYTAGPGVLESMKQQSNTLSKFSRALATLGTTLLSFADAEGDHKTLPEDVLLLGFSPLKAYYTSTLNPGGLKRALERGSCTVSEDAAAEILVSRSSRVLALAKRMGERKEVEFFGYEEGKGKAAEFLVKDEESKVREDSIRLARLKTAKSLALQLLKTQVSTLETNLASSSRTPTITTYIPDASIYTNHLPLIKTLLIPRHGKEFIDQQLHNAQERRLLVPMDIVHQLDNLKKGSGGIHARAREATRYLEQRFRYGSDSLVSQQSGQTIKDTQYVALEDEEREDGYCTTPPKYLRSFIGCCLYFQKKGVEAERERVQRMQEIGVEIREEEMQALVHGRVFVVSEDEDVILECRRCGVAVKTVKELRKSGEYGRRW
ncbi:UNVERIFIED_CONTAM: hypothetical protein HDU68_012529 [Siphonaria sp. JEL0065]|nr:hypothetical protein HDU68_012529 [Siphonaria sp. JEL0065]